MRLLSYNRNKTIPVSKLSSVFRLLSSSEGILGENARFPRALVYIKEDRVYASFEAFTY